MSFVVLLVEVVGGVVIVGVVGQGVVERPRFVDGLRRCRSWRSGLESLGERGVDVLRVARSPDDSFVGCSSIMKFTLLFVPITVFLGRDSSDDDRWCFS